jgi:hypothetical protein
MRDRLDADTTLAELPCLIDQSVQLMMDDARRFLADLDFGAVPTEKIRAALSALEQEVRLAETLRLNEAWLALHESTEQ